MDVRWRSRAAVTRFFLWANRSPVVGVFAFNRCLPVSCLTYAHPPHFTSDAVKDCRPKQTSAQTGETLSPRSGRTWAACELLPRTVTLPRSPRHAWLILHGRRSARSQRVDVRATPASRIRVLDTGRSNANDPNDPLSVAIAALGSPGLRPAQVADHGELLRVPAKRNHEIRRLRNVIVSRLHAALQNLSPGGIAKELNASDAAALLRADEPVDPVEHARYGLALELLDDVQRLDVQLQASHERVWTAVQASGTTLTDLCGVGPILA